MPHINYENKYIFVHIPKCAGNTVKNVLNIPGHDHSGIEACYKSDFFKFAFVRNPWDRFISAYLYLKSGGWRNMDSSQDWDRDYCQVVNSYNSLKEFVREPHVWLGMIHFRPQFGFVVKDTKDSIDCLDFIGRVENLDNDLRYICSQINVPYNTLPHINKTKNRQRDYTKYYDDELRDIIAKIYSKDIEYFKYKFG